MQLLYTLSCALHVAVWHPGRPQLWKREDQQTPRHCLGLVSPSNLPPNIQSTSKHFYNLHINSHWDRDSKKISPWNLDTDPLEDYWESQWANQIDNSSQLTECLLIKSCSSASQSTINCGFWEKPTADGVHLTETTGTLFQAKIRWREQFTLDIRQKKQFSRPILYIHSSKKILVAWY